MEAIERARQAAGGPRALARLLTDSGRRITSQAVGHWKRVPSAWVLDVSRLTGVSLYDLRPDLYPGPEVWRRPVSNSSESAA
jgi:DNA-binding transcriptional regulator YdaS (Cro superfamily)